MTPERDEQPVAAPPVNRDRVLVCGGREYRNRTLVFATLSVVQPKRIAEGGARGADALAREWAAQSVAAVQCDTFAADWTTDGKAAGVIRNGRMLREFKPTLVVAFPGGKGTADMVRRAERAGVPVIKITDGSAGK
jgi:hypothetical protein